MSAESSLWSSRACLRVLSIWVGAHREHRGAAPAGNVPEGMREKRFAHAHWTYDGDMGVGVEEAQSRELVEQRRIEGDLGGGIPRSSRIVGSKRAFWPRSVTARLSRRATSSLSTGSRRSCWHFLLSGQRELLLLSRFLVGA